MEKKCLVSGFLWSFPADNSVINLLVTRAFYDYLYPIFNAQRHGG